MSAGGGEPSGETVELSAEVVVLSVEEVELAVDEVEASAVVVELPVEDVELSIRVGKTNDLVYLPQIEVIHHGRLSSRSNVAFAAPNLLIGYVHFFRKTGVSKAAIFGYKLALTIDTPLRLFVQSAHYLWRRLVGRRKDAERNRLTACGLLHFLFRDLIRFWRA